MLKAVLHSNLHWVNKQFCTDELFFCLVVLSWETVLNWQAVLNLLDIIYWQLYCIDLFWFLKSSFAFLSCIGFSSSIALISCTGLKTCFALLNTTKLVTYFHWWIPLFWQDFCICNVYSVDKQYFFNKLYCVEKLCCIEKLYFWNSCFASIIFTLLTTWFALINCSVLESCIALISCTVLTVVLHWQAVVWWWALLYR